MKTSLNSGKKRDSYFSMTSIDEYGTQTSSSDNKLFGKIGKLIKFFISYFFFFKSFYV